MSCRWPWLLLAAWLLLTPAAAEEVPASLAACGMAGTLMGTVVFMMSIFYLLNHSDADMRKYSANVVSSTISIFCAVLMFTAINGLLEEKLNLEELDPMHQFGFDLAHMGLWFVAMQIALALTSGALLSDEKKLDLEPEVRELDMKCYATLLAHMTGFAAINAFAQLQQTDFFSSEPKFSFLVVPIALVSLYAMQRATDNVRERIALSDGTKDEFETLWDEETEEAENDVMGLALSFTAAQGIRFAIGGYLPNIEGVEPKDHLIGHTTNQKMMLLACGVAFATLTFCLVYLKPEETEEHIQDVAHHLVEDSMHLPAASSAMKDPLLPQVQEEDQSSPRLQEPFGAGLRKSVTNRLSAFVPRSRASVFLWREGVRNDKKMKTQFLDLIGDEDIRDRLYEALSVACSMTMAWCLFYSGRWFLARTPGIWTDDNEEHSDMMMLTLLQALVLSAASFSLIRVLDLIADMHCSGPKVDKGIVHIIEAMGILVGFAWEQCFDTSVAAITSRLSNPSEMRLVFAVFVFIVLVPAWKMWILPMDVCWGWKHPALAKIQNEEMLEEYVEGVREAFRQKQVEEREHEEVEDLKDDAKLHREGRDDIKRTHIHRSSTFNSDSFSLSSDPTAFTGRLGSKERSDALANHGHTAAPANHGGVHPDLAALHPNLAARLAPGLLAARAAPQRQDDQAPIDFAGRGVITMVSYDSMEWEALMGRVDAEA